MVCCDDGHGAQFGLDLGRGRWLALGPVRPIMSALDDRADDQEDKQPANRGDGRGGEGAGRRRVRSCGRGQHARMVCCDDLGDAAGLQVGRDSSESMRLGKSSFLEPAPAQHAARGPHCAGG